MALTTPTITKKRANGQLAVSLFLAVMFSAGASRSPIPRDLYIVVAASAVMVAGSLVIWLRAHRASDSD